MPIWPVAEPKPFTWSALSMDDPMATADGEVTDAVVRRYAFAVDDHSPWHLADSPFGGPIGHSLLLADDALKLALLSYRTDAAAPGGVHARGDFALHRPVRIGEWVSLHQRPLARYVRGGRRYWTTAAEARDRAGAPVLSLTAVLDMGEGDPDGAPLAPPGVERPRIATAAAPDAPAVSRARDLLVVGARLPTLHRTPTLAQSIAFSGFPHDWLGGTAAAMRRSFHTDPERAALLGHRGVVVQGLVCAAYFADLCARFFGEAWFTTGRLEVVYVKAVYAGDALTVSGIVAALATGGAGARVGLELWCANEAGAAVTVARASAAVSRDRR